MKMKTVNWISHHHILQNLEMMKRQKYKLILHLQPLTEIEFQHDQSIQMNTTWH